MFKLRSSVSSSFFIVMLGMLCCARPATSAEPPPWIAISSTHFSLVTDAGEKKGREVAFRFEQMRAVFAQLLIKNRVNLSAPLEIYALKSAQEYQQIAPLSQGPASKPAFFLPGDDRNFIVLNVAEDDPWRAVTHDFARWLLNFNYPPTQSWFDEGFAQYFCSLHLDNKQVLLGGDPGPPSKSFTDLLNQSSWIAVPELFATRLPASDAKGSDGSLFYAESWIVMHYLLDKNKLPETGIYFELTENEHVPIDQAIQKAYGVSPAQFEEAVKDYLLVLAAPSRAEGRPQQPGGAAPAGPSHSIPTPIAFDDTSTVISPVLQSEVASRLAEIRLRLPERRAQAIQELQGIVSQPQTDNVVARRALGWAALQKKDFAEAIAQLGKASELNPDDHWARYYLALIKYRAADEGVQHYHGLSNMMQDLRAVLDWYPEFAEAYSMLAMARVEGGGINSATESMRAALQLSPRNDAYVLNMARIYIAAKNWDAATALLNRLTSSTNAEVAAAARTNLQDLPTLKKYGLLPQRSASNPAPIEAQPLPEPPERAAKPQPIEEPGDRDEPAEKPEAGPDKRPVKFLRGKLVSVDCSRAPEAVLTVTAGLKTLKLHTADYKTLLLIGADQFSCDWSNRAAEVNYKEAGKSAGDLVSLEMH